MIYLDRDSLEIRFPEVHENAGMRIDFQRTLRLPDNGESHHLPPGLGRFPLRHIASTINVDSLSSNIGGLF